MTPVQDEYQRRCTEPSDIVQHLPALYKEVASRPTPVVVELGVRKGNSTVALLAGAEFSEGRVWSVDIQVPFVPDSVRRHKRWIFTEGDDLAVSDKLPSDIDVLFIDTSHTMVQTLAELVLYVPKVKPGGVVLLHDTELEDVKGDPNKFPVAAALDEYCAEHGMAWDNTTGCGGLGRIDV